MERKISVRIDNEMYLFIEKFQKNNNLEDLSDSVREIINEKIQREKPFFYKLKKLFEF